ncbi:MAG: ferrous iron transport protein A [Candidatus Schekmanbacteria bacterium]|nr:ferrous iron transport protein A [Candidatus Schekmanbacteria bacterium]
MLSLGLLSIGEKGEVIGIQQKGVINQCLNVKDELCSRIENMGLRIGKIVEMLSNQGQGPLLVKVDNTRIAVARSLAMKILVKKEHI